MFEFEGKHENHSATVRITPLQINLDFADVIPFFLCILETLQNTTLVITLSVDHPSVQYSGHRAALLLIELQSHPLN